MEDFYDGYIVNAIIDACYKSAETKQWVPVDLAVWRGSAEAGKKIGPSEFDANHWLIKEEKMPDGQTKVILKEKSSGKIVQKVIN
jgi:hypothetical protein